MSSLSHRLRTHLTRRVPDHAYRKGYQYRYIVIGISLYRSRYIGISLYRYRYIAISVSVYRYIGISISIYRYITISVSVYRYIAAYRYIAVYRYIAIGISVSVYRLSIYRYIAIGISQYRYMGIITLKLDEWGAVYTTSKSLVSRPKTDYENS